jgi:hypothetical protein
MANQKKLEEEEQKEADHNSIPTTTTTTGVPPTGVARIPSNGSESESNGVTTATLAAASSLTGGIAPFPAPTVTIPSTPALTSHTINGNAPLTSRQRRASTVDYTVVGASSNGSPIPSGAPKRATPAHTPAAAAVMLQRGQTLRDVRIVSPRLQPLRTPAGITHHITPTLAPSTTPKPLPGSSTVTAATTPATAAHRQHHTSNPSWTTPATMRHAAVDVTTRRPRDNGPAPGTTIAAATPLMRHIEQSGHDHGPVASSSPRQNPNIMPDTILKLLVAADPLIPSSSLSTSLPSSSSLSSSSLSPSASLPPTISASSQVQQPQVAASSSHVSSTPRPTTGNGVIATATSVPPSTTAASSSASASASSVSSLVISSPPPSHRLGLLDTKGRLISDTNASATGATDNNITSTNAVATNSGGNITIARTSSNTNGSIPSTTTLVTSSTSANVSPKVMTASTNKRRTSNATVQSIDDGRFGEIPAQQMRTISPHHSSTYESYDHKGEHNGRRHSHSRSQNDKNGRVNRLAVPPSSSLPLSTSISGDALSDGGSGIGRRASTSYASQIASQSRDANDNKNERRITATSHEIGYGAGDSHSDSETDDEDDQEIPISITITGQPDGSILTLTDVRYHSPMAVNRAQSD